MPRSTSSFGDAAQKKSGVVARQTFVQLLLEHLDAGDNRLAASRGSPRSRASSPTFTLPRSIRPVTTVPRPEIEKMSSIGIRNGRSIARSGMRHILVHRFHQLVDLDFSHCASPFNAPSAEPRMTGRVVARVVVLRQQLANFHLHQVDQLLDLQPHRTCSETRTMYGTPTWRASSTCSLVCGIGPSVAATTRIAPSICAAPVIMFLM